MSKPGCIQKVRLSHALTYVLFASNILFSEAVCAQFAPGVPNAPKELQRPADQTLLGRLNGKGNQIYVCQNAGGAYAWKLRAPDAKLFGKNGDIAGRHFAGPTWEAKDGSRVTGKLTASVPAPDAGSIPWLLLTATSHEGTGVMNRVASIQRLETIGSTAPANGCDVSHENAETSVPYSASYYFYSSPR